MILLTEYKLNKVCNAENLRFSESERHKNQLQDKYITIYMDCQV